MIINVLRKSRQITVMQDVSSYAIIQLPKGNGSYRTIYCVDDKTKESLRELLKYLEDIFLSIDGNQYSYGFVRGRNCALNALQHTGYEFTLSFDMQDFFETVTPAHVSDILDNDVIEKCFINNAPQQGLPTSPLIANIAFVRCDTEISNTLNNLNVEHVYTRYADDITISLNRKTDIGKVKSVVKSIVCLYGFKLNDKKTKLQSQKGGRAIITGIGVDRDGIHATRKTKKKLRAAKHQQNQKSVRGLNEWSKCKLPSTLSKSEKK